MSGTRLAAPPVHTHSSHLPEQDQQRRLPASSSPAVTPASVSSSVVAATTPSSSSAASASSSAATPLRHHESALLEMLGKLVHEKAELFDENFQLKQELFEANCSSHRYRGREYCIESSNRSIYASKSPPPPVKSTKRTALDLERELEDLKGERNVLKMMFDDTIEKYSAACVEKEELIVQVYRLQEKVDTYGEMEQLLQATREALVKEREGRASAQRELRFLREHSGEPVEKQVVELHESLMKEISLREELEQQLEEGRKNGFLSSVASKSAPSVEASERTSRSSSVTSSVENPRTKALEVENSKLRQELGELRELFEKNNRRLQKEIEYGHLVEDEYEKLEDRLQMKKCRLRQFRAEILRLRTRLGVESADLPDSSSEDETA